MEKNLPLAITLMGPTATGKTDLAMRLAETLPVDVISVDSALIYRSMDIGTAKPDADFLVRLPHRLIDIRDADQSYSVAEFRRDALEAMADSVARNRIPLLVGGTMMYFKALIDGLADMPATDTAVRERVGSEASELGWPVMHGRLAEVDPESAARIHPNHSQRIQRALEVFYSSGKPLSAWQAEQADDDLPYQFCQFALLPSDRSQLHQRIEQRFLAMLEAGFVNEVRQLRANYRLSADMMSMRAVGYRQAWEYLEGSSSHEAFVDKGIAATRQLAKRQLTWLRKWPDLTECIVDFAKSDPLSEPLAVIMSTIRQLLLGHFRMCSIPFLPLLRLVSLPSVEPCF